MNKYMGHDSQAYGIEEHRLVGGKGDGLRLLQVRTGTGLDMTVAADRCADIYRLSYKGINLGFFAPCGYVAPAYYDERDGAFSKSFTAGFLTTCGLTSAGPACEENGELIPQHGTIGNSPAEHLYWDEEDGKLVIHALMRDAKLFSHKLDLYRTISCNLDKGGFEIRDKIVNRGDEECPIMLMYHMNMGYPLLSEKAELFIPAEKVEPRDPRAAEDLDTWYEILEPQTCFAEQCYFHSFSEKGLAAIYNHDLKIGLAIHFNPTELPFFTQWKQMGTRDYVMGLEPGNCHPIGQTAMRKSGKLQFLAPGESMEMGVRIEMIDGCEAWNALKQ